MRFLHALILLMAAFSMSAAETENDVTLVSSKHTNAVKLVPGPNDANIAKLVGIRVLAADERDIVLRLGGRH